MNNPVPKQAWLMVAVFALAITSGFVIDGRAPLRQNSDKNAFGTERAMAHLKTLSQTPRPAGTPASLKAISYLQAQLDSYGLATEVVSNIRCFQRWGINACGPVSNVIGTLKGTSGERVVVFAAHYDSVFYSPGAGDNGAATAALLETARALASGDPPLHDLVFVFTDGEEGGLQGAAMFAQTYPRLEAILALFNFDARGSSGPVYMYETSSLNSELIHHYSKAVRYPQANSVAAAVYRFMPNGSDFLVFKENGINGLNFANIGRVEHYHTMDDTYENQDMRTLVHKGQTMVDLGSYFGNLTKTPNKTSDAVFFNLVGPFLIAYSGRLVWPLMLLLCTLLVIAYRQSRRHEHATPGKILLGGLSFLLVLLSIALSCGLTWYLLTVIQPVYATLFRSHIPETRFFFPWFCLLTTFQFGLCYRFLAKRLGTDNLVLGTFLTLLILAGVLSAFLVGASWLLVWPLFAGLCARIATQSKRGANTSLLRYIPVPAILGVLPVIPLLGALYMALPPNLLVATMLILAMLLGCLCGYICYIFEALKKFHYGLLIIVVLGFVAGLVMQSPQRVLWPPTFYAQNDAENKAWLASATWGKHTPDEDIMGQNPTRRDFNEVLGQGSSAYLREVTNLNLPAPMATLEDHSLTEKGRLLYLRLSSQRPTQAKVIRITSDAPLSALRLDGVPLKVSENTFFLEYWGDGSPLLEVETSNSNPIVLELADRSAYLPDLPDLKRKGPLSGEFLGGGFLDRYTTRVYQKYKF